MNLKKLRKFIKNPEYSVLFIKGSEMYELIDYNKAKKLFVCNDDFTLATEFITDDNIKVVKTITDWESLET